MEGVKTTKQGELETVAGELAAFNTEKAGKDKENAKIKFTTAFTNYLINHHEINELMMKHMKSAYLEEVALEYAADAKEKMGNATNNEEYMKYQK